MKREFLLLICLITTSIGLGQSVEKQPIHTELKEVVYDIIQLVAERNIAEIDKKYTHSKYKIWDVFRIGVHDSYQQRSSIAFAFPTEPNSSVYPNLKEVSISYSTNELIFRNVTYDCNEMVWNEEGFFIADSISYPKLSEEIEENTYRVVLTEFDIIFYISKIDNAWYLTLFDRVTTDCSA